MAREQDTVAGAKQDTLVLVGPTSITQDDGQRLTDLTASAAGAFESPSARAAIAGPMTVEVRWTATAAEASKVLAVHGDQAITTSTWLVATGGGGMISLSDTSGILWTSAATVPAKDLTIAWSIRANPDTAGAGDAMISEVLLYNHTDSLIIELEQFTHAITTTNAAWDLGVGGWWDGAVLQFPPTNAVELVRLSSTDHPHAEMLEDWTAARAAYAGTDDAPTEPPGPIPISAGMGAVGMFAGRHPWAWSAAHVTGAQHRNWSPAINEVLSSPQNIQGTAYGASPEHWLAKAPESATASMWLQTLAWVSLPEGATHARVRVQTKSLQYLAFGGTAAEVKLHAFNRPPQQIQINGQQAPAIEHYRSDEASITRNDGAGDGEWTDLGLVRLARFNGSQPGWPGTAHFALDVEQEYYEGSESIEINALHVIPVFNGAIGVFDP